jgi:hypothetical protein
MTLGVVFKCWIGCLHLDCPRNPGETNLKWWNIFKYQHRPSQRPHYLGIASVALNVTFPLSWEVENKEYRIHAQYPIHIAISIISVISFKKNGGYIHQHRPVNLTTELILTIEGAVEGEERKGRPSKAKIYGGVQLAFVRSMMRVHQLL